MPLWLKSRAAALVALALISGTVLFLPIAFPIAVDTYGKISPAHRWMLLRGQDGQLVANTFNYETGLSEGYGVFNFNRGSSVYFSVLASLAPGQVVSRGDTLGSVFSSEMQERLVTLNGELATARQMLEVTSTGEKAAVVREAQQRLDAAKRRMQEHQKVMARSRNLLTQNLISQGEYERVEAEANTLNDEIAIAATSLESARSGAKPEQLKLVHANIAALESEITSIQGRAASYTVTAPITGTISREFSSDTLLTISDTSHYIATIPLRLQDYARLAGATTPPVTFWQQSTAVHGKIIGVSREIRSLRGEKVIIATARLDASGTELMPGMLVKCRIDCPPVTPLESAKRYLRTLPTPRQWWSY